MQAGQRLGNNLKLLMCKHRSSALVTLLNFLRHHHLLCSCFQAMSSLDFIQNLNFRLQIQIYLKFCQLTVSSAFLLKKVRKREAKNHFKGIFQGQKLFLLTFLGNHVQNH